MSTDWKQNSFFIATLMTTNVLLLNLPIGNGLKTPAGEVISEEIMRDFVKPVNNSILERDESSYNNEKKATESMTDNLSMSDNDFDLDLQALTQNIGTGLLRKKRSYLEEDSLTVEVLVAVDSSMTEFHKDGLRAYINNVFAFVSAIFSDGLIDRNINFKVIDVHVMEDGVIGKVRDDNKHLGLFCEYISKRFHHYDTAMFITRNKICKKDGCKVAGVAQVARLCEPSSCSLVQDKSLTVVYTIAHELGHIFSMRHDNEPKCTNNFNLISDDHIMNSSFTNHIFPRYWSPCSRQSVLRFLNLIDTSCLLNNRDTQNTPYLLPGEIYSLNEQCHLLHGDFWKHSDSRYEVECKELRCSLTQNDTHLVNYQPWADGTPCGNNNFWCQRGECVPRYRPLGPAMNGGWGPWSDFGPCSLSCGGGVQESERECSNPWPRNGGRDCVGIRRKYKSCNTQSCPPGSLDARQQQCNNNIPTEDSNHGSAKWVPYYSSLSSEKCRLFCQWDGSRRYRHFSNYLGAAINVTDGAACSRDSVDKCVNGECVPAGCDNVLHSTAKLDKCGFCNGNSDTCEEYTGNFYLSDLYKMPKTSGSDYSVTTIPKGAFNILINQRAHYNEYTLGLRDDENNYLLNPNQIHYTSRRPIDYAGVLLTYNRRSSTIEDVNSALWRKLKRDLVVEITAHRRLPDRLGVSDTLLLTYTYTINKARYIQPEIKSYRWERQDKWSDCSALCDGKQTQWSVCVNTANGFKVESKLCDQKKRPFPSYRPCNRHCKLVVQKARVTECSESQRPIKYRCIQTFPDTGRWNIVDLKLCLAKPKLRSLIEAKRSEKCSG